MRNCWRAESRWKAAKVRGTHKLEDVYEFIGFKAVSHNISLSTLIPVVS